MSSSDHADLVNKLLQVMQTAKAVALPLAPSADLPGATTAFHRPTHVEWRIKWEEQRENTIRKPNPVATTYTGRHRKSTTMLK